MNPRYLPLLVLGLLPAESRSSSSLAHDTQASETRTASAPASRVKTEANSRCDDLHEVEVVLAEQELHLLDHLASPTVLREEKEIWQGQLTSGREFLENIDRAKAALSCPRGSP